MPSLADTHDKMRWAKVHLEALNSAVDVLVKKANPQASPMEQDTKTGEWIVTVTLPDPDVDTALIFGDFINCARSALDYMAWQLALLTTSNPSRDIGFPICEKDSLDTQLRITRMTYGIPDDAVVIMKSLQPYIYGETYKISHLWRLNKLWNIVKHRHVGRHSTIINFLFPPQLPKPIQADQLGNSGIMRFAPSPKPDMSLYPTPEVAVRFGDESEGVLTVVEDLWDIYQFIGTIVLPKFESFFPK